jgi:diguanylate cyclase (GGDEF)-like protein/PAS domain S-box-containing protein
VGTTGAGTGEESGASDVIERARSFDQAFDRASVGLALLTCDDDHKVVRANRAWCDLLGWTPEEMLGRTNAELTHPDDLGASRTRVERLAADPSVTTQAEKRVLRCDGSYFWALVSVSVVVDAQHRPEFLFTQMQDITPLKYALEALRLQATHDSLTGTLTRAEFIARVDHALLDRRSGPTTVFFIDLNGFKAVNDRIGHVAADTVLATIGVELRSALRPTDCVGRWGGDEFVVVCPGLDATGAAAAARRLHDAIVRAGMSAAIGTATATPGSGVDTSALIAAADADMYRSKRSVAPR